jgi:hypothetical protein
MARVTRLGDRILDFEQRHPHHARTAAALWRRQLLRDVFRALILDGEAAYKVVSGRVLSVNPHWVRCMIGEGWTARDV